MPKIHMTFCNIFREKKKEKFLKKIFGVMDWIFVNPDSIRLAKNIRVPSPLRRSYDCACVCQELKHSAACGQCPLAFVTPEELEKHQGRNANISIS